MLSYLLLALTILSATDAFVPIRPASLVVHHPQATKQQHYHNAFSTSSCASRLCLPAAADDDHDDAAAFTEEETVSGSESEIDPSLINGETKEDQEKKRWWKRGKKEDDGLSFRQTLAKAGLSVVLSYGAVSNMSYGISMSIAWYAFSRKTGLSPLAPDQWKPFLAVYSAFFVFNNIVRPIRFAASVAVSPYFDRLIAAVQKRTKLPRGWAIGICVLFVNVLGTVGLMASGISVASMAAGVPPFPMK